MEVGVLQYFEWLAANLKAGDRIGVDPAQVSAGIRILQISSWYSTFQEQIKVLH